MVYSNNMVLDNYPTTAKQSLLLIWSLKFVLCLLRHQAG